MMRVDGHGLSSVEDRLNSWRHQKLIRTPSFMCPTVPAGARRVGAGLNKYLESVFRFKLFIFQWKCGEKQIKSYGFYVHRGSWFMCQSCVHVYTLFVLKQSTVWPSDVFTLSTPGQAGIPEIWLTCRFSRKLPYSTGQGRKLDRRSDSSQGGRGFKIKYYIYVLAFSGCDPMRIRWWKCYSNGVNVCNKILILLYA